MGYSLQTKRSRGLGLKNLGVWNEVLMTKHLWNVAIKNDTLWVKWISMENLKGRSIWEVQSESNCSVGWKNILSLRDKVRSHTWWKIRNGRSVNVIHDRWCSVSPLSDFIDTRDVYDARPRQVQVPRINEENDDTAVWVSRLDQEKQFKISNVWKDMNCNDIKAVYYIWQERNSKLFKNEKKGQQYYFQYSEGNSWNEVDRDQVLSQQRHWGLSMLVVV
ncbi:hypothetical protein Tco_1343105 [Tanacetum coccineum]